MFPHVAQCGNKRTFKLQVLSYDEAAKRANLVRRSLERRIAIGEGPAVIHLGKRRRGILESDLEAWLTARRHAPPGETASKPLHRTKPRER
jgi:predicted DNA-binding transcriptional regulator AlpA